MGAQETDCNARYPHTYNLFQLAIVFIHHFHLHPFNYEKSKGYHLCLCPDSCISSSNPRQHEGVFSIPFPDKQTEAREVQ